MSVPFYEVAAITAYTGRHGHHQNEANFRDISRQTNPQSSLPLNWSQVSNILNCRSTSDHVSSDRTSYAHSLNLHHAGQNSFSADLGHNIGLSSTETLYAKGNDTPYQINSLILSKEANIENAARNDDGYLMSNSGFTSLKEDDVVDTQSQPLKNSSALWKDKFGAALDNIFEDFPSQKEAANFVQHGGSLSGTSECVGSWFESSMSHREGSTSSSYWGGSSACTSTGVSLESDMDDCPLLASTMIEMENKFTTETDLLEAMQIAQLCEEGVSGNVNDANEEPVSEIGKNNFQGLGDHSGCNLNFLAEKEGWTEFENIPENINQTSSHFLDMPGKDETFPQLVEDNIKHVANQLFELQQSNLASSQNNPSKIKSYRDVLVGVPSTNETRAKTGECIAASAKFTEASPEVHLDGTNTKISANKATFEQTYEDQILDNADDFLQIEQWATRSEVTTNNTENVFSNPASDKVGKILDSFHSAKSSDSQSSSDVGSTSSSESGVGLYKTALSRLVDSGDESGSLSEDLSNTNEMTHSEKLCDNSRVLKTCALHEYLQNSSLSGNLADVDCSCETDSIRKSSGLLEGTGRARKRQRALKKVQDDSDSGATEDDVSFINNKASRAKRICDGKVLYSADGGSTASSVRSRSSSSSDSRGQMSSSRDCSSSSRSSSLSSSSSSSSASSSSSSSCSETFEPGTTKLNPECPPFIPRASRLHMASSRSSSTSSTDLKELRQEDELVSAQTSGIESDKSRLDLDASLMPPPSSTKVPVGSYPHIRRINQLRHSYFYPSDSGIDTTGQYYNTSANISQGGNSLVQTMHDSAFPAVETLDESNFQGPDFWACSRGHEKSSTAPLYNNAFPEQFCAEDRLLKYSDANQLFADSKTTKCLINPAQEETERYLNDVSSAGDLLEPSPYVCELNHELEFIPLSDLTAKHKLKTCGKGIPPLTSLPPHVVCKLVPLSQRVVRLRVKKSQVQPTSSTLNFLTDSDYSGDDHYGTGFVYDINQHFFEVRTHEAVVRNAKEAASAEITFELLIAGDRYTFVASGIPDCSAADLRLDPEADHHKVHFCSNAPHSQVTSFRRATPAQLVPWIYLFPPVPTKTRTSFFEDSCYYSDSSPDCSLVENNPSAPFELPDVRKRGTLNSQPWFVNNRNDDKTQQQDFTCDLYPAAQPVNSTGKTPTRLYMRKGSLTGSQDDSWPVLSPKTTEFTKDELVSDEAFSWNKILQNTSDIAAGLGNWNDSLQDFSNYKSWDGFTHAQNDGFSSEKTCSILAREIKDSFAVCDTFETLDYHGANDVHGNGTFSSGALEKSEAGGVQNSAFGNLEYKCITDGCHLYNSTGEYEPHPIPHFEYKEVSADENNNNITSQFDVASASQSPSEKSLPNRSAVDSSHKINQDIVCQSEETRSYEKDDQDKDDQNQNSHTNRLRRDQDGCAIGSNKDLCMDGHLNRCLENLQDNVSPKLCGEINEHTFNDGMENNAYSEQHNTTPRESLHQALVWKEGPGPPSCPLTPGAPTSRSLLRERQRVKDLGDDHRPSSPLVIMERRAAAEGRATMSGVGLCPYSGVDLFGQSALYTCFSSYAGNIIDSLREDFLSSMCDISSSADQSILAEQSWEFANILFAQNSHRKAYTRKFVKPRSQSRRQSDVVKDDGSGEESSADSVFLPDQSDESTAPTIDKPFADTSLKDPAMNVDTLHQNKTTKYPQTDFRFRSHRSRCDGGKGEKRTFAPTDPFEDILDEEKYMASWDIDLLNLNPDLTPAQDPGCVESSLAHVFADTDDAQKTCCQAPKAGPLFTNKDKLHPTELDSLSGNFITDARAIIISHPHGGRKMLSSGFFSRHFHIGGNLYDTPTCMGSCGAPVISLAGDGSDLHVTSLVHVGNVSVNGINTGMGVELFPPKSQ